MTGRRLWIALGTVVLVVAAAVVLIPRLGTPDLRSSLAEALNVDARDFFLNIPPAPNRYPGSVFATEQWLPLERAGPNDSGFDRRAAPFTLRLARLNDVNARGGVSSGFFGELLKNRSAIDIDVHVDSAVVLEMSVPDLKRRLLASDAVRSALDRGARPVVVTRAYEGRVTLTMRRRRDTSGEGWAAVTKAACVAGASCTQEIGTASVGKGTNDTARLAAAASLLDTLSVIMPAKVVFAYQIMEVGFVTTHLGASGPDSVSLRPVRDTSPTGGLATVSLSEVGPASQTREWALITVASGFYPNLQTRSQPWNAVSAALIRDALKPYGPRWTDSLAATPARPLSDSGVVAFVVGAARRAKAAGARSLVLYYIIGHTFAVPGRDVSLLMGDAAATPSGRRSHSASLAKVGIQVDGLARFADQLEQNLSDADPGVLPLGRLYAALDSVGLPFALLVDGCLENNEVMEFRQELSLVLGPGGANHLDYVGPDGVVTWQLGAYADMLRHFADAEPYLHGRNPVVLAAKPGTLAMASRDPRWAWGDPVGPLAARIASYVDASRLDAEPPDLAELIRQSAEFRGLGEIRPRGSISWSDFDGWRLIAGGVRPKPALP